jgi:oxygen-dependent protoporphyrinogen oxidase
VTAVSFASRKWAHWRPPSGGEVLRISLGRDGNQVPLELDDGSCATVALQELARHAGLRDTPDAAGVRVTRWPSAFPQYAPGHLARVDAIEASCANELPHVRLTGAGFRGIGIPACIRQGFECADLTCGA